MGEVIGEILPLAVGVGISPVPIIAVILMLGTPRGATNGAVFLLGWLAGAAIAGTVVLVIADAVGIATGGPSKAAYVFKIVLGALLLVGAFRQWRGRPKEGEEPEMPKWMQALNEFTWPKSLGLGALLSGVNPKNLVLIICGCRDNRTVGDLGRGTDRDDHHLHSCRHNRCGAATDRLLFHEEARGGDTGRVEDVAGGQQLSRRGGAVPGFCRRPHRQGYRGPPLSAVSGSLV